MVIVKLVVMVVSKEDRVRLREPYISAHYPLRAKCAAECEKSGQACTVHLIEAV